MSTEQELAAESVAIMTAYERVDYTTLRSKTEAWGLADIAFIESQHGHWTLAKSRYGPTGAVLSEVGKRAFLIAQANHWAEVFSSRPMRLLELPFGVKL